MPLPVASAADSDPVPTPVSAGSARAAYSGSASLIVKARSTIGDALPASSTLRNCTPICSPA
jgi:hypothetical protein